MSAIIDYWAGTFPFKSDGAILSLLSAYVSSWAQGKGSHGYTHSWVAEGFRIFYGGVGEQHIYVQVSGQGCRAVENSPYFRGWDDMALMWLADGFRPTRIDLAYDDREGVLPMLEICRKGEEGEFTSHMSVYSESQAASGGVRTMSIAKFGHKLADKQLVIYDKRLETLARGGADPGSWVRVELRFKDKAAGQLALWIKENSGLAGAEGFLRGTLNFRDPGPDTNKSRWQISAWWASFIGSHEKQTISVPSVVISVQKIAERFRRNFAPTLAMLVLSMCDGAFSGKWLSDTIIEGWGRMSPKQVALVRQTIGHFPGQATLLPEGR